MPRDGSFIYSIPPGTEGVPDTTIESAKYNGFIFDVAQDLNTARPILAGGTAGTNVNDALTNLTAEKASQLVTNFDSHVWLSGSFHCNAGATGAPETFYAYNGFAIVHGDPGYITLEARATSGDENPGWNYVRQKRAGVWGDWFWDLQQIHDDKVSRTGDVMTGNLAIYNNGPVVWLQKQASGQWNSFYGSTGITNADVRWRMDLGDGIAESGASTGSDFALNRFSNVGAYLSTPLHVNRGTGAITLRGNTNIAEGTFTVAGTATFSSSLSVAGAIGAGSLTVSGGGHFAAMLTAAGDLTVSRGGSPGTGYIYLGNTGARYMGFDGTNFQFYNVGTVTSNSGFSTSGHISASGNLITSGNAQIGGALSASGLLTANGGLLTAGNTTLAATGNYALPAFSQFTITGALPAITFHYPSVRAVTLSMGADGNLYWGGASNGTSFVRLLTSADSVAGISQIRLVARGDHSHNSGVAQSEPFSGAVMTGLGMFATNIISKYRDIQVMVGGVWYASSGYG